MNLEPHQGILENIGWKMPGSSQTHPRRWQFLWGDCPAKGLFGQIVEHAPQPRLTQNPALLDADHFRAQCGGVVGRQTGRQGLKGIVLG